MPSGAPKIQISRGKHIHLFYIIRMIHTAATKKIGILAIRSRWRR